MKKITVNSCIDCPYIDYSKTRYWICRHLNKTISTRDNPFNLGTIHPDCKLEDDSDA